MKLLLSIFSIVLALNISASPIVPVKLSADDYTVRIDLEELSKHGANVTITDENGFQLVSTNIKANTHSKTFDFSKVSEGHYTLRIENDSKIVEQIVTITNHEAHITKAVVETYKPFVTTAEEEINVNLLSLGHSAAINITDSRGNEIYAESFNDVTSITKRYKTSNLSKGDYIITIFVNGKIFNFNYNK